MSILDIGQKVLVDNSISAFELHTHQALTTRYQNNDEIRIPIQDTLCTLPSESHLYIEGSLLKDDKPVPQARFCNNGIAFLFSQIRYEMNGVVVDSVNYPGITSTIKGYASFSPSETVKLENAGWCSLAESTIVDSKGNFNACVPLKMLLGFAEDYKRVITNIRQELVLIRANSDKNAIVGGDVDVKLNSIFWKVPHIRPGLQEELALTKYIGKGSETQVAFRNWQLHSYPAVNETMKHTWAVSTMTKTSSPRYVILAFQTDRDNDVTKDCSRFDSCNFQNIRVFLNDQRMPYNQLNINFPSNKIAALYEMYASFQSSYYGVESLPLMGLDEFKNNPLIVVDTSKQQENLSPSSITLRVEYETSSNVPKKTVAYCLVLADKVFSYNPLTKMVRQI